MKFNPQTLYEKELFQLNPESFKNNLGLHTINFHD